MVRRPVADGRPTVLVLTTTYPGRIGDGTPQFVHDLCAALASEFRMVVLAPRVRGAALVETVDGVEIHRFAYFPSRWEGLADGATLPNLRREKWRAVELPFLFGLFQFHAWRMVRRLGPDLVHAHWVIPTGLFAELAVGNRGIPVVLTAHGVDLHALRVGPLQWLRRWTISRATTVLPVSEALAGRVRDLVPDADQRVIPMGADTTELRRSVGSLTPRPGHLLFVGRLAEKKGVGVLLRALAGVEGLSLTVAGDGPDRAGLENLSAELGLIERVRFLGRVSRNRIPELMRSAQAMVIPSVESSDGDMEGTPLVLAEAVAVGLPVIASRLGGIADQMDDTTAVLVDPGDVRQLEQALRDVAEGRIDLSSRAREATSSVAPRLDLANTAEAYRSLYNGLVPPGSGTFS